ncbi:MAG: hypothetical protein LBJ64_04410 [Deltaproteobacteria bacterium]|nr:hypothetical protein [Deltaproteobacteria bacterium]
MTNISEKDIQNYLVKNSESYGLIFAEKEVTIAGLRIDIFALDKEHNPYILEIKKDKDRHIVGQAIQYYFLIKLYKEEIEKKINFYDIKWDNLSVICLAKEFLERDYQAVEDEKIKNVFHLYIFNIITTNRDTIFSLNLVYKGPNENGPLVISSKNSNSNDLIQLHKEFLDLRGSAIKKDFYTKKIKILLDEIGEKVQQNPEIPLFPHVTYSCDDYYLRMGASSSEKHRASIILYFSNDVFFGFDLTHSLLEGQKLATFFKTCQNLDLFCEKTLLNKKYFIYIPNTGIKDQIYLYNINNKGLIMLLKSYNPIILKDCYFHLNNIYKNSFMSITEATELITTEYHKFKYIFDILLN